ncbi:MAG: porin [Hyphomicrobiales bacterium]|nr:porin [Hyphomicrobiales bacterium]
MKTTSRFALAAAAGLFVGGIAFTPAKAADLGGDCCADLEERVAELEATTARKGNRKVSLEISGQVNRALLVWDDGRDSDAYLTDVQHSNSRFRFIGKAKMKPGWNAGFAIEIAVNDSASSSLTQANDEGNGETVLSTRLANWFIESEKLGRITLGQGSPPTDDIILISLANTGGFTSLDPLLNAGFTAINSGTTWGNLTGNNGGGVNLDSNRGDFVRYDSPSIYGFILSAAWGENDVYDIALYFKKEWNSIRIAAGVGYYESNEGFLSLSGSTVSNGVDYNEIKGSISLMHVPTGLYVNFAGVSREVESGAQDGVEAEAYYVQAGIEKKWLSYGATTIYGEYGTYDDFAVGIAGIDSSEVERYGFGVAQSFDSAAIQVYAAFSFYDADIRGAVPAGDVEDMSLGLIGSRIKF